MKRLVFPVLIILFVVISCPACGENGTDHSVGRPDGSSGESSSQHNSRDEAVISGTDVSLPADEMTAAHGSGAETTSASFSPATKEDILAVYRSAVETVRGGGAGYDNKTWQSAQVSQLTGIPAVDEFVNTELNKRATSEAEAETVRYKKGTAEAMAGFPACTLEDEDKIVYAASEPCGENVKITIVMQDEDTPLSVENSMLGKVTDIILFKNEIERELRETLPVIKNYEYNIVYRGFEITCELTGGGRFVSLRHHAIAEVNVSSVQLFLFDFTDKSGVLIMDSDFSDFVY